MSSSRHTTPESSDRQSDDPIADVRQSYEFLFSANEKPSLLDSLAECVTSSLAEIEVDVDAFSPFLIETLLEETSSLLNRCLAMQSEKYDLEERAIENALLFFREDGIDRILDEEITAGKFSVPAESLETQRKGHDAQAVSLKDAFDALVRLGDALDPSIGTGQERVKNVGKLAFKNAIGADLDVQQEIEVLAVEREKLLLAYEDFSRIAGLKHTSSSKAVAESEAARAALESAYEKVNVGFRSRRREIHRHTTDIRKALSVRAGGAFNYCHRFKLVQGIFEPALEEAWKRMLSLQLGLQTIFGIDLALPDLKPPEDFLYKCVHWTHQVLNTLMRVDDWSCEYRRVFSLRRQILSKSAWRAGLASGRFNFSIDKKHFANQALVRLRGFNLFVQSRMHDAFWTAKVRLPEQATVLHLDDAGAARGEVEIDQSHLRACSIGDVTERRPNVRLDPSHGATALNSSPIGDNWEIEFDVSATTGDKLSRVEDVCLELHLATVPLE